jgi:hypothetical protein
VPHVRFQMNILEEIESTWKGEQLRGNEHRFGFISCRTLPRARALRPSHGSYWHFGTQDGL